MARGPETRFIASIHRLIAEDKPYWMKTHNPYIGGPADVWYSGGMGDAWIEYKYVHKLPPVINLLDRKKDYSLSALQEEWLRKRFDEGRRVFVVLGCAEGGVIFKRRSWEDEHQDPRVHTRREIAEWIAMLTEGKYEAPVRTRKGLERCI